MCLLSLASISADLDRPLQNDSERALRKTRLSANGKLSLTPSFLPLTQLTPVLPHFRALETDIAKERDRLSAETETLRSLLQNARAEVLSVRSSVTVDKAKLEQQMAEERRQKDSAKRELESRLEAMQKRKSKFNVS